MYGTTYGTSAGREVYNGELLIEGGRRLNGTILIGGAKNSVLKLMAAAILGQRRFTSRTFRP